MGRGSIRCSSSTSATSSVSRATPGPTGDSSPSPTGAWVVRREGLGFRLRLGLGLGLGFGIGLHLGGSKCERSTFSWRSTLRGWRCMPIHSRAELNWPLAVRTNALNGCSAAAAPAKLTPLGPAGEVAASGGGRGGGAQLARPPTASSSDKGTPPSMLEMLDRREPGEEPATEGGGISRRLRGRATKAARCSGGDLQAQGETNGRVRQTQRRPDVHRRH